jgi:hypothetical protein
MRKLYLALAVLGFLIPLFFTAAYTLENPDNFLFIMNPAKTFALTFGTYGNAAFSADLAWVMLVFFVWLTAEARRRGMAHPWVYIALTLLVGMSGPFPLFLYFREGSRSDGFAHKVGKRLEPACPQAGSQNGRQTSAPAWGHAGSRSVVCCREFLCKARSDA